MSSYQARLRLYGDVGPPLRVDATVSDSHLLLNAGDATLADWPVEDLRIEALEDGFHIRAEGEDLILEVDEDAAFAVDLGLKNAHPSLRRRMSALLRDHD